MKDEDRSEAFEKFMEGVNGLLADRSFREVLLELDREGKEAASLLAPDPAAFLKQHGQIPEDFRLSVERRIDDETGTGEGIGTLLLPTHLLVALVRRDLHLAGKNTEITCRAGVIVRRWSSSPRLRSAELT